MLRHVTRWFLREETIKAANAALSDFHHQLPISRIWGVGTTSSADGQRFGISAKLPAGLLLSALLRLLCSEYRLHTGSAICSGPTKQAAGPLSARWRRGVANPVRFLY
jgi:hypothetical protein